MADKFAIITGASTGIGFELASLAAADGYDLLVAADEPLIDAAAADFREHGVEVKSVEADLSTIDGVDKLLAAASGRHIDVLCANAGTAHGGAFLDQDLASWRRTVDTNIVGTAYLLQKVLKQMVSHGEGRLLVTGSIAGYVPGPFNAMYNATKAFIDNFTDALREELKDYDADIVLTTLMPGATDTEFFARAEMLDTEVGQSESKANPAKPARDGWKALMNGEDRIVSGLMNKLQVAGSGIAPPSVTARMHRKMAEPGGAED